jgi:hypothetical protein
MDQTSFSGTFNLERVLGTVPSKRMAAPPSRRRRGRPLFFVSLDANDLSVKRMQVSRT